MEKYRNHINNTNLLLLDTYGNRDSISFYENLYDKDSGEMKDFLTFKIPIENTYKIHRLYDIVLGIYSKNESSYSIYSDDKLLYHNLKISRNKISYLPQPIPVCSLPYSCLSLEIKDPISCYLIVSLCKNSIKEEISKENYIFKNGDFFNCIKDGKLNFVYKNDMKEEEKEKFISLISVA